MPYLKEIRNRSGAGCYIAATNQEQSPKRYRDRDKNSDETEPRMWLVIILDTQVNDSGGEAENTIIISQTSRMSNQN